jgi:transcription termination/antitermination protein NusG
MAKKWYIVHAYSNLEKKVAESIRERAKMNGLDHLIEDIQVPSEDVIEIRRGKKVPTERRLYPGYVLVKMEMTDPVHLLIKNTPRVTGFLGADNKAMPIPDREAERILNIKRESVDSPKTTITFEIGEQVKVGDGPFEGLNGTVEEVDEERMRLKVAVAIFGRPTRVDLDFNQVQKVAA